MNLGLNLILVPRYGALGAAIGTCTTLLLHNVFKQAGLLLGTGVTLFRRRDLAVYGAIVLAAALLFAVQLAFSPPVYVGFFAAAVASLFVVGFGRGSLRAAETFPELMRFRLARLIIGR